MFSLLNTAQFISLSWAVNSPPALLVLHQEGLIEVGDQLRPPVLDDDDATAELSLENKYNVLKLEKINK